MEKNDKDIVRKALLPTVPEEHPKDGDGNILHEGDRVFGYDVSEFGIQRVYGTLLKSDEPETLGHWYVEYDDEQSFMVLSFKSIFRASKA